VKDFGAEYDLEVLFCQ